MSHDHMPQAKNHYDAQGNELPPIDDRSVQPPEPRFRDDAIGQEIRDAEAAERARKAKKTRRVLIGGGVATVLGVGAAIGGNAYLDQREAAATDQRINEIFEEEADQYPYEKIPASVIPEVGISASVFSTPQEVVDEYYAQETAWVNFGYTDEQRSAEDWGKTPKSEKDASIMTPVNDAYMDGLYINPSDELVAQIINENIDIHNVSTTRQEATDMDPEVYHVEHTPVETQIYNETPESFTAATEWVNDPNSEMNGSEGMMLEDEDGVKFMNTLDFVLVDGNWKVENGYKTRISY